jgi:hypothetical protein
MVEVEPTTPLEKCIALLGQKPQRIVWNLNTYRAVYWLYVDHLIPKNNPFREKRETDYEGIDYRSWAKMDTDLLRTTNYTKQKSFLWRSTHGLLYANRDFHRFKIKDSEQCNWCTEPKQTVKHVYTECDKVSTLFANLHRHLQMQDTSGNGAIAPFTEAERYMGADGVTERKMVETKCLNIMRKYIYDCNHRDEKLNWESYVSYKEKIYCYEYAIADKNNKLACHLMAWNM